jgi:hypothetical protein
VAPQGVVLRPVSPWSVGVGRKPRGVVVVQTVKFAKMRANGDPDRDAVEVDQAEGEVPGGVYYGENVSYRGLGRPWLSPGTVTATTRAVWVPRKR